MFIIELCPGVKTHEQWIGHLPVKTVMTLMYIILLLPSSPMFDKYLGSFCSKNDALILVGFKCIQTKIPKVYLLYTDTVIRIMEPSQQLQISWTLHKVLHFVCNCLKSIHRYQCLHNRIKLSYVLCITVEEKAIVWYYKGVKYEPLFFAVLLKNKTIPCSKLELSPVLCLALWSI